MRTVVIMGAGGRDFHDFNVRCRPDPETRVVAFTAAQIPGIDDRVYPASLAGPRYPQGIPIRPESELVDLIHRLDVDEVVLAYSDLSHEAVMHKASIAMAAGAGPATSMNGPSVVPDSGRNGLAGASGGTLSTTGPKQGSDVDPVLFTVIAQSRAAQGQLCMEEGNLLGFAPTCARPAPSAWPAVAATNCPICARRPTRSASGSAPWVAPDLGNRDGDRCAPLTSTSRAPCCGFPSTSS